MSLEICDAWVPKGYYKLIIDVPEGYDALFLSTHPHPSSQLTGLLGLCSQSLRCDCSWSSRSVAVQPKPALSQLIWSLDSMLRMMRGTGRRWASVTTVRSTGHICCWANHCVMQALQKACSQCGAWKEKGEHRDRKIKPLKCAGMNRSGVIFQTGSCLHWFFEHSTTYRAQQVFIHLPLEPRNVVPHGTLLVSTTS